MIFQITFFYSYSIIPIIIYLYRENFGNNSINRSQKSD